MPVGLASVRAVNHRPMRWGQFGWYAVQIALIGSALFLFTRNPDPTIPTQNVGIAALLLAWAVTFGLSRIIDWWQHGTWFAAIRWWVPRLVIFGFVFQLVRDTASDAWSAFAFSLLWIAVVACAFYGSQWLVDALRR